MTLCLWLATRNFSTIKVEVDYVEEEKNKVKAITYLEIYNVTSKDIENWRHICVTWMSNFGVWKTYLDGAARDHGTGVLDREELNRGNSISIHFDSQVQKPEFMFSRLNVWNKVLPETYILYMSYKCGAETGNYLRWNDYLNALPEGSSGLKIYRSTCKGKQGNVLSLISPSYIKTPTLATITSPRYERSSYSPGRCLKFRYKIWGAGARALKIYQELDNKEYSKRPIWTVKDSGDSSWRDGQVTLTAVMGYKLIIQGEVTSTPGLLSIGALYTTEGNCVDIVPQSAMKVCNEILSNKTGKIYSPYYPGYYDNNANCTWTIKASKGHVIQLEFKAFELESSTRCSADFVEVYDGEMPPTISRIGRYCGTNYPRIIQSQSSTIKVVFKTNNDIMRTGFKAYYQIIKDAQDSDHCVQDCPFDCNCQRQKDGGIIVSSAQLLSVPNPLPMKTKAILFSGSQIHKVESNAYFKLSYLSLIDLSCNRVFLVEEMCFVDLPSLRTLRLRRNFLREVQKNMFSHLPQLEAVDLGENLISTVGWDAFSGFPTLRALSLRGNRIKTLHQLTFQNNTNLTYLYLQDNLLKTIPPGIFKKQKYLEVLFLHKNRIEQFDKSSFEGLKRLRKLTLKNNPINEQAVSREVFENLRQLEYLSIDSFILCCYAKESIPKLNCVSPGNEFSSCNDMLKSFYVRICIWVEGICAALGNLAVIAWWVTLALIKRKTSTAFNSVQSLLLCHLALADFLMGVYLLFIATYDELWKGEYFKHDVEWRAGVKCKIAGVISTLSSEVSVMILVAITADRMNTILFQFSGRRTNLKVAHVLCLCIWVIGFIMSFTPLLVPAYFNDEISGFSFYGRSTVCLPLQLSTDRPAGWEYSVAVFIGFNGAAFLFILLGYLAIFIKVRQSARRVRSSSKTDTSLAKRVFFVILTDFCCWMPVVVIGLLSLTSGFNDPSVYIWIAVFVLPVNSSINPIVYTFSSPQTIKNLKLLRDWWLKKEGRNAVKDQHSSSGATRLSALKTKEEIDGDHDDNKMAVTSKILRPSEDYSIDNECEDTKL